MTFEEKIAKIEEISKTLQDGNTPLEKAVELYEEGMKTAHELDAQLSKLERRVEIVTSNAGSEDCLITEPYGI